MTILLYFVAGLLGCILWELREQGKEARQRFNLDHSRMMTTNFLIAKAIDRMPYDPERRDLYSDDEGIYRSACRALHYVRDQER